MEPNSCPSEQQLHDFQLGNLPEPLLNDVANHLENCRKCETVAQRLDTDLDPILAAIRSAPSAPSPDPTRYVGPPARDDKPEPGKFPFLEPAMQPDEIGRLGRYRVLRLLGKGGMAFVFQAEDMALRRAVALKVMKPDLDSNPEGWQRFLREARIMASIKHEHLATVFQADRHGDGRVVYMAMELLHGESLDERLERIGAFEPADVIRLGREIASGLAVVHRNGLIHRDVKPANIWLETPGDRVKILDFGLARSLNDDVKLTQSGVVMGTPNYMSPEQARGENVDVRTDLFSLGCVLYSLSTGKGPFDGDNTMAVLTALAVTSPPPVQHVNPKVPEPLSDLIMALLSKDPRERPASAAAVMEQLESLERELQGPPGGTTAPIKRPATLGRIARKVRHWAGALSRRRWLLLGLAAGLVALALFCVLKFRLRELTAYPPIPGAVYLTDLKEVASENFPFADAMPPGLPDNGPSHWPPPKGGVRVVVGKYASLHGIWMHLPVRGGGQVSITYALDRKFSAFSTQVGLNVPASSTPLTFSIYGDERLLWKSNPVSHQADLQSRTVSIKGFDKLRLQVDGPGEPRGSHAIWIEPHVLK